jgi:TP53 regulating kinase-like protein
MDAGTGRPAGAGIIARGAEAVLYLQERDGRRVLVKDRLPKGYRVPELDRDIRTSRTRLEGRLLDRARRAGVPAPGVLDSSDSRLVMEFVEGERVKEALNSMGARKRQRMCGLIGQAVARMHAAGIVHGDLTTSNMLLSGGRLYLIDFGLGRMSRKPEDQANDLYLLREALKSAHFAFLDQAWKSIIKVYIQDYSKSKDAIARLEKIDKRRRYKTRD